MLQAFGYQRTHAYQSSNIFSSEPLLLIIDSFGAQLKKEKLSVISFEVTLCMAAND